MITFDTPEARADRQKEAQERKNQPRGLKKLWLMLKEKLIGSAPDPNDWPTRKLGKAVAHLPDEMRTFKPLQGYHTVPYDYVGDFYQIESSGQDGNTIHPTPSVISEREARAFLAEQIKLGCRGDFRIVKCRRTNPGSSERDSYEVTDVIGSFYATPDGKTHEVTPGALPEVITTGP